MALSYAVIAPLLLPPAVGYFISNWLAWRYCAIFFYERSYESGGRMFETLFTLMVRPGLVCCRAVLCGVVLALSCRRRVPCTQWTCARRTSSAALWLTPPPPPKQTWTLAVFSIFTAITLGAKNLWAASLVMLCTQLPALFLFHRCVRCLMGQHAGVCGASPPLTSTAPPLPPAPRAARCR